MATSYNPYYSGGWQSGEEGNTPITPDALNHMDTGIAGAFDYTTQSTAKYYLVQIDVPAGGNASTFSLSIEEQPDGNYIPVFVPVGGSAPYVPILTIATHTKNTITGIVLNVGTASSQATRNFNLLLFRYQ